MPACPPTSDAACRVDVRILALAIPPLGLAPDAIARAEWNGDRAPIELLARPWVWQHGTVLLLLEQQPDSAWLLSELSFDPTFGYYTERRRAEFAWAREAVGAALSRVLGLGNGPSLAASAALDAWCTVTFEGRALAR
jgi:hypothetical protein